MAIEATDTVPCGYCGGQIKRAAKICKHCLRERSPNQDVATPAWAAAPRAVQAPPAGLPEPSRARVVSKNVVVLRDLLASRGIVAAQTMDAVRARAHPVDASAFVAALVLEGHLTPVQVENVRTMFGQQQHAQAMSILNAAAQRGLLSAAQCDQAIVEYDAVALSATPDEFLVDGRVLTPAQVARLSTENAVATAGLGSVSAPQYLPSSQQPQQKKSRFGYLIPIVLVSAGIGGLLFFTRPDVHHDCTMNGLGHGTCAFTNRGYREGASCGRVRVACGARSTPGAMFCSGTVRPNDTFNVPFVVTGIDLIRPYQHDDWRQECDFDFFEE